MNRDLKLVALAALLLVQGSVRGPQSVFQWPPIQPFTQNFYFPDARRARLDTIIRGLDGKPLYLLRCRPSGEEDEDGFYYSGDFECRLTSFYESTSRYTTLLTDNPLQQRDWESRARVLATELQGDCAHYPEYGRIRNFRLRNMQITLEFSDYVLEKAKQEWSGKDVLLLRSFRLSVLVEPDSEAVSAIAEDVPFAEPPYLHPPEVDDVTRRCDTVIEKHVAGRITKSYIEKEGLALPYAEILPTEKSGLLPRPCGDPEVPEELTNQRCWDFEVPIFEPSGRKLYEFVCSADVPNGTTIDRSGIGCALLVSGAKTNLLADAIDPYSRRNRATILPEQLYGRCAYYPDWGAERIFRLRGFRLSLQLRNPVFVPGVWGKYGLRQVEIHAKVEPDSDATLPVAGPSPFIYWGIQEEETPCEKVLYSPFFAR